MYDKLTTLQQLIENKIIAVIRGENVQEAAKIVEGAYLGGIKVMEVTYTVPDASKLIKDLSEQDDKDWVIGAGTVLDEVTARLAILSGASFIVSPSFDEKVAKLCNRYQVPYIPGCFTASEIIKAMEAGADIIKIFPGNAVSPSFIKTIKGPIPQVNLMPSGGVNLNNITEWIDNGAVAVSIGSNIYKDSIEEIKEAASEIVNIMQR
ncbi:bifunctional 2-keto-4-hydroxyglutarate aldolase/2-keto-3-deoxy-6-phosphogluconate aldolase [Oceanobacillus kapialis]|uniref:Bifunctional 2-keto-4-hydroxyglutarate aldolase/2-keto-3-deoxy-6-phosphogluconate aldolase n=1 Tax=Oceanobacillus kapialis TaxID=481353 RepID=A0ABW5PW94_9BACI